MGLTGAYWDFSQMDGLHIVVQQLQSPHLTEPFHDFANPVFEAELATLGSPVR